MRPQSLVGRRDVLKTGGFLAAAMLGATVLAACETRNGNEASRPEEPPVTDFFVDGTSFVD